MYIIVNCLFLIVIFLGTRNFSWPHRVCSKFFYAARYNFRDVLLTTQQRSSYYECVCVAVCCLQCVLCIYHVCVSVCIFGELSARLWRSVCRSSLALLLACKGTETGNVAGAGGEFGVGLGRGAQVRPGRWQLRWMNILILANRLHIWAMAMPSTAMTCAWTYRCSRTGAGHEVKQRFRRWRWRDGERGQALE